MKRKIIIECSRIAQRHVQNHPQIGHSKYFHYSFVIQRNKLVEWGVNRCGNPIQGYNDYSQIHSEIDAYFKARGLLDKNEDFEIVNIRLRRDLTLKISEPCECCSRFLINLGCKRIWFSTRSGNFASIDYRINGR